jgi:hypothetical protein
MRPSLGGKPPQRGTRVGGLLSVSGCSGGGAPLTGGEGDRRGPLAAEGVGALHGSVLGFYTPGRGSFARSRGVGDGGATWRAATSGIAAWWRQRRGARLGGRLRRDARPGGGVCDRRGRRW